MPLNLSMETLRDTEHWPEARGEGIKNVSHQRRVELKASLIELVSLEGVFGLNHLISFTVNKVWAGLSAQYLESS